jgi:hypothetical protein
VTHPGLIAHGDFSKGATSDVQAGMDAGDSHIMPPQMETEVAEPHWEPSSPKGKVPSDPTAASAIPEVAASEVPHTSTETQVSPRRLPSWAADPFSPKAVPRVTPSESEEESLPSSLTANATSMGPSPQVEEILHLSPHLDLSGPSSPTFVNSSPTFVKVWVHLGRFVMGVVDTEQEDADIEAFRAEADSLKARFEVRYYLA